MIFPYAEMMQSDIAKNMSFLLPRRCKNIFFSRLSFLLYALPDAYCIRPLSVKREREKRDLTGGAASVPLLTYRQRKRRRHRIPPN